MVWQRKCLVQILRAGKHRAGVSTTRFLAVFLKNPEINKRSSASPDKHQTIPEITQTASLILMIILDTNSNTRQDESLSQAHTCTSDVRVSGSTFALLFVYRA